jgi:exodeoxyribonuclease VII small subunit
MPARNQPDSATQPAAEEFSFEEALARLEEIVEELESGPMALEEALKRFEEGTRLQRVCLQKLQQAETRIEQVLAENAAGADSAEEDVAEEPE